jgi:hypothetical protein
VHRNWLTRGCSKIFNVLNKSAAAPITSPVVGNRRQRLAEALIHWDCADGNAG